MSHTVTVTAEIKNKAALEKTCQRLDLEAPIYGEAHRLYSNTKLRGYAVKLPGWNYPVVCDLDTGKIAYDNYGGVWGEQSELHKFLQTYAVVRTMQEASLQGYTAYESQLEDGTIKVTVNVGE